MKTDLRLVQINIKHKYENVKIICLPYSSNFNVIHLQTCAFNKQNLIKTTAWLRYNLKNQNKLEISADDAHLVEKKWTFDAMSSLASLVVAWIQDQVGVSTSAAE